MKREPHESMEPETARLARDLCAGDREAFAALYSRVAPSLFAWAALRIRDRYRALIAPEDLLQEVWVRALGILGTYDSERASFRAWIFSVAKYVLLELYRACERLDSPAGGPSTRAASLEQVPDAATRVSRRVARDEGLQLFLERVGELGEDDRKLVLFCGLEGMPHGDVAQQLGLSNAAVTKRWQRLRATLGATSSYEDLLMA